MKRLIRTSHKHPGLLYPMIRSQRVEATAKWKEQSTDVNYEINPAHRQLGRPQHPYPKLGHCDRQVPGRFEWEGGFLVFQPRFPFSHSNPIDHQGRKFPPPPPPLFFFFRWRGDGRVGVGGRCAGSREGRRELVEK